MEYNVRIDDNFLRGDHVDGEVLEHSDLNELENVAKTAINANYEDIQKLQDGTILIGNSEKLGGASLSKFADENLQNSDTKVPTSSQVKQYVDGAISNIDLNGYYTKREVDDTLGELYGELELAFNDIHIDFNQLASSIIYPLDGMVEGDNPGPNENNLNHLFVGSYLIPDPYATGGQKTTYSCLIGDQRILLKGGALIFKSSWADDLLHNYYTIIDEGKIKFYTVKTIGEDTLESTDIFTTKNYVDTLVTNYYTKTETNNILTDYPTKTDYATSNVGGVIKVDNTYDINVNSNGKLEALTRTFAQYEGDSTSSFISKGTLENVLANKPIKTLEGGTSYAELLNLNTIESGLYNIKGGVVIGDSVYEFLSPKVLSLGDWVDDRRKILNLSANWCYTLGRERVGSIYEYWELYFGTISEEGYLGTLTTMFDLENFDQDIKSYLSDNYYTKSEIDTDLDNYYTKTEINESQDDQNTQIQDLQNENNYLNSIIDQIVPKVTGSGEYITLNNTIKAKMDIDLHAKLLSQFTTTGKNKLGYPSFTSKTVGGVTFTNNKGVYTIGGTTGTDNVFGDQVVDNYTIQSGDYIHYNNNFVDSHIGFTLVFSDNTNYFNSFATSTNRIFSLADYVGKTITHIRFNFNTGYAFNGSCSPMIVNSSTATDFEPYTGGIPAPNPQYPQDIHTISGSNKVVVSGKNLFDNTITPIFEGGSTSNTINTGYRLVSTVNGPSGSNNACRYVVYDITPYIGEKITLSAHAKSSSTNKGFMYLRLCKQNGDTTNNYNTQATSETLDGDLSVSYTIPSGIGEYHYLMVALYSTRNSAVSIGDYVDYTNLQLEVGDKTTYEPYIGEEANIDLPVENLFNKNNTTNGRYDSTGTFISDSAWRSTIIQVQPNTSYTFSGVLSENSDVKQCEFDKDMNFIRNQIYYKNGTITTASNCKYINATCKSDNVDNFMVEKGTKANKYTPYGTTPIEYCKIGDYEDEFMKPSGTNILPTNVDDWEQGGISASDGQNTTNTTRIRTKYYYPIQNDIDYYISIQDNNYGYLNILLYNSSKTFLNSYYTIDTNISGTQKLHIKIPSSSIPNVAYMRVTIRRTNDSTITPSEIGVIQPMINLGTTQLPFEPYGTGWYLKKNIGEHILDGTAGHSFLSKHGSITSDTKGFYQFTIPNRYNASSGSTEYALSNYFKFVGGSAQNAFNNNTSGIWWEGGTAGYCYAILEETSLTNANAWLTTHNTKIKYVLATPQYLPITGTLANQLENIKSKLLSQSGTTNISQVNNDLPFELSVSAFKSLVEEGE